MKILQFESQMFLDALQEDGLTVLAKGLGIERLLISLLKVYSDPGNLVIVLGTTPQEEEYLIERLEEEGVSPLPKVITAEYGAQERYQVYMDAGIVFVTSRILVVDMLMERIPTDLITGIIVYRAHKILESCQEAFILRLYRQKNKKGFIKALSASPISFTRGFCQVQRVMRNLFVRKLYLWPRYHANVCSSLEQCEPEVIELHITMTTAMQTIQMALLDLLNECLKAIKRMNPSLDVEEMTVENAIARSFDKIVKFQLDPVWHQLGPRTKRLIADIKTLRTILMYLTQYDCVTFYKLLKSIRESAGPVTGNQVSDWMFMDSAETIFVTAKERVFGGVNKRKKGKTTGNADESKELHFEENPKWSALSEILAEIREEEKTSNSKAKVLIITEDDRTSSQLKEFLQYGSQALLTKLYNQTLASDGESLTVQGNKGHAVKRTASKSKHKIASKNLKVGKGSHSEASSKDTETETNETDSTTEGSEKVSCDDQLCSPETIVHPLKGRNDPFALQRTLGLFMPNCIVMYDADMGTIRHLEMYQSLNPDMKLRVYFLAYKDSAEEQRYLMTLRLEKTAFEFLINEKQVMVVPEDRDGKTDDHPDLVRDTSQANETVNTRKAGGQTKQLSQQKVIVDLREFRSELPSLIHRRGIDIEPVTLQVGDYILSPEMCVERKSISDLIGSLNSGRLYNQAQAMCRHYSRPVLLIEFDQNKAFSLQGNYYISKEISSSAITSKLILLTLHFPRLRILWSPSPYATAEMFEMFKIGKEQPDAASAQAIMALESESEAASSEKYFSAPKEVLSKMPGVNSKNIYPLMNRVKCLADIISLSVEQLTEIMGNSLDAKSLWEAIHQPAQEDLQQNAKPTNRTSAPKGIVAPLLLYQCWSGSCLFEKRWLHPSRRHR